MNALEIRGLTKYYPGFSLQGLDLTLPEGCILGLVGENGAGKTTTIRLILDMLHKDGGTIRVLGRDHQANPALIREQVGVVLDEVGVPGCLRLRQVDRVMEGIFRTWDSRRFAGYIEQMELPQDKPFEDFSRGMKMKLGIAIALSHDSRLLLLDEATAGLDPVARDQVVGMLEEFTRQENHSILISSHIVSDLEKLCDYIAFLHQGRLLFCEEKDALLDRYGILTDSAEQADALAPEAIVAREPNGYGGVRCLVRRDLAPVGFQLEKPSVEDIILFLVKGAKHS